MKTKLLLVVVAFLCISNLSQAQKKSKPLSFITGKVNISKYHERGELDRMRKGDLLKLYVERIEVIVNILPNIAFATNPNVTMSDIGIPDTKENVKALENNKEASKVYFDNTIEFQKKILPYSDTNDLITAILFYESTLKSLYTYNDFKSN
ncbi:hypothetical protein ACFQ1Q_01120 [Winogradskyella litorisediminis]|uniref:Uncharacterized protein n=1 Tax=Winogradskyella litorisediminis TaxID=1156618 RepID=A0ABW3N3C9_9FLAO